MSGAEGKSRKAVVSIRAVFVDCPNPSCGEPLYEPATPNDIIAWGTTIRCWACDIRVKLPVSPFK